MTGWRAAIIFSKAENMKVLTRVYDSYSQAAKVVAALETVGIPSEDISLIANRYVSEKYVNAADAKGAATGAGVGAVTGGSLGLLTGLGIIAIPGLGPVVAVGWLAAAIFGAAAGAATGGFLGAVVGDDVPEADAHVLAESVRRGGTMVTARVSDSLSGVAATILQSYEPVDPVTRRVEYVRSGWSHFDPSASPYTPTQAEIEHIRRE